MFAKFSVWWPDNSEVALQAWAPATGQRDGRHQSLSYCVVTGAAPHCLSGRAVIWERSPPTPSWHGRCSLLECTTSSWSHRSGALEKCCHHRKDLKVFFFLMEKNHWILKLHFLLFLRNPCLRDQTQLLSSLSLSNLERAICFLKTPPTVSFTRVTWTTAPSLEENFTLTWKMSSTAHTLVRPLKHKRFLLLLWWDLICYVCPFLSHRYPGVLQPRCV